MKIDDTYKMKCYMGKEELIYLRDILERVEEKSAAIVNIGTYYGASAAALLVGMEEHGIEGPLFCIGLFRYHHAGRSQMRPFREREDIAWSEPFIEQAKANIAPFVGSHHVRYYQAFSDDFPLSLVDAISLIFIDADHSTHACLLDALKYSQKLIRGGFMLFHDYVNFSSVREAIRIFREIRPDFTIAGPICGSILTLRKEG